MAEFVYLLIVLATVAIALQVDFIFYIIYLCVGLYAFGRLIVPFVFRRITVVREYNDHAFLGEYVPVSIRIHNGAVLPIPFLTLAESVPITLRKSVDNSYALALNGKASRRLTYELVARRRGLYQIGPLLLQTGDFFGFSNFSGTVAVDYLTVYPMIIPLTQMGLPSRLPFGTVASHQRLFADPARPMGVRDYRSGDSQRQIHWKVSAHTRELMVKTFQPAISLETQILVNLDKTAYARRAWREETEWAITVAASVAAHLSQERQSVGMMSNGLDPFASQEAAVFDAKTGRLIMDRDQPEHYLPQPVPAKSGRANLMKVLETLARLEASEGVAFESWAVQRTVGLTWGTTLVVITPRGDEAMCQLLHRFLRNGYNPILLVIGPTAEFGIVRERARNLGFRAFHVLEPVDLEIRAAR